MAWYCKAVVARHRKQAQLAQKNIRLYLASLESERTKKDGFVSVTGISIEEAAAKGWTLLTAVFLQKGKYQSRAMAGGDHSRPGRKRELRGINGILYMVSRLAMSDSAITTKRFLVSEGAWQLPGRAQLVLPPLCSARVRADLSHAAELSAGLLACGSGRQSGSGSRVRTCSVVRSRSKKRSSSRMLSISSSTAARA